MLQSIRLPRLLVLTRNISISRPAPPSLPQQDQREFEELLRKSQTPLASPDININVHPDARPAIKPDFEGEVNPQTGEKGGPKKEPIGRWSSDSGGDWSFKGRVSDF